MVHEVLLDTKVMSLDSANNMVIQSDCARAFPRPWHFPCDIDQRVFLLGGPGTYTHNGSLIAVSRLVKERN